MALITGAQASLTIQGAQYKEKEWRITYTNKVKASANSQSAGWEETAKGISSWRGTLTASMEGGSLQALSTVRPGDLVAFIGYTEGSFAYSASGYIRIESFEEAVPTDGDELYATVNFIGDGSLTIV